MPLLRVRELTYIADKAKIRLALTDARVAAECEQAMTAADGRADPLQQRRRPARSRR